MAVEEWHSDRPPLRVQVPRESSQRLRGVAKPVQEQRAFRSAIQRDRLGTGKQFHPVGRGFKAAPVPGAQHPPHDGERRNYGEAA